MVFKPHDHGHLAQLSAQSLSFGAARRRRFSTEDLRFLAPSASAVEAAGSCCLIWAKVASVCGAAAAADAFWPAFKGCSVTAPLCFSIVASWTMAHAELKRVCTGLQGGWVRANAELGASDTQVSVHAQVHV